MLVRFGLTSRNVSSDAKSRNRLSLIIFPNRNIWLPNKARGISIKAMLGLCWHSEVDKQTTSIVSQVQRPSTARCNVNSRESEARRRKLAFPSGLMMPGMGRRSQLKRARLDCSNVNIYCASNHQNCFISQTPGL